MTDKRFQNITSISCNGGLILCSFVYDRPKHYVLSREGAKQRTTMKPVKLLNRKTAVGSSYGVQITKDTANVQCLQTHFTQFDDFHTILYCLLLTTSNTQNISVKSSSYSQALFVPLYDFSKFSK